MSKTNWTSFYLLSVPTAMLLVLSFGYVDRDWRCLVHTHWTVLPWALLAALPALLLWFWPCKRKMAIPLLVFASIYSVAIMKENITLSQELDRIAMFSKQADLIHNTSGVELKEKSFPRDIYGEYAAGLDFIKKSKVYFEGELSKRLELMKVINFNTFYSPEVLSSPEALSALRNELENSFKKMRPQYRQVHNYYSNLIRIFNESKWKNSHFKSQLAGYFQPQSAIRLDFYKDLYANLRDQLFLFDDMVLFFLNRQGHFVRGEKGEILFRSEIDSQKYNAFCRDIDELFAYEQKLIEQYEADIAYL
ncbi:MAG: hypothetical protein JSS12_03535 [Verrucomicrobia bacterium]|nr:hypothetical protein [Verrucomicrobiota bacterium]